ncbi:hypothetical protein [Actinophytocola oryzae]|uniref:Uncharacterized protein n=1 Tax=Actinophytocola oryzae TaxID=502181 RepID=A0A4R7VCY6_9PSEU|nr:hypothetical protein [Actinophytocola oryzae]TDV46875.1 hypothetical protein CLV71_11056 [Actinophytocola oryzae]
MSVVEMSTRGTTRTPELTEDVEALLAQPELEGVYRETEKCAALLLAQGQLLLSPPTPRRKR